MPSTLLRSAVFRSVGRPCLERRSAKASSASLDGEDLRGLPLGDRKKRLARLLGKRRLGIVLSEHTDEDGATIFLQACKMGLEGLVSKRLSAPYQSGSSRDWIKVKNPESPAMIRAREAEW
jgi:ATP-dependent DNA ligase